MANKTLKSIGAVLAGFVTGAILSVGADFLMEQTNMMSRENFKQSSAAVILTVILYRFVFNVTGCYLTARLAPDKPMKHALIIGVIGTVLSILGTIAMWDWQFRRTTSPSFSCRYRAPGWAGSFS